LLFWVKMAKIYTDMWSVPEVARREDPNAI
jgi:hypothetical protein